MNGTITTRVAVILALLLAGCGDKSVKSATPEELAAKYERLGVKPYLLIGAAPQLKETIDAISQSRHAYFGWISQQEKANGGKLSNPFLIAEIKAHLKHRPDFSSAIAALYVNQNKPTRERFELCMRAIDALEKSHLKTKADLILQSLTFSELTKHAEYTQFGVAALADGDDAKCARGIAAYLNYCAWIPRTHNNSSRAILSRELLSYIEKSGAPRGDLWREILNSDNYLARLLVDLKNKPPHVQAAILQWVVSLGPDHFRKILTEKRLAPFRNTSDSRVRALAEKLSRGTAGKE